MNILLNVRWPVGGIRTYMRYVYRCFPDASIKLTLLAPPTDELEVLKRDLGGHLKTMISCDEKLYKVWPKLIKLLRQGHFDLVHSHGLGAGLTAALPVKLSKVPHIVTLHDVFLKQIFSGPEGNVKRFLINYGLRLPDTIHLLGDDQKENLFRFFPAFQKRQQNIEVIKSGIETGRFLSVVGSERISTFRAENNLPIGVPVLGFFGRFMAQKGFVSLVDALDHLLKYSKIENVPFVVAFGSGGFLEREKRLLQERGLLDRFRFLPFLPNIATVFSQLDGVVMPSRWEAAPLLPMEVLVSGVPLLASDCIGLREITEQSPAFKFKQNDVVSLAHEIQKWCTNPRSEEFVKFSSVAAKRFDARNTAGALQKLYSRVVKEFHSSRWSKSLFRT